MLPDKKSNFEPCSLIPKIRYSGSKYGSPKAQTISSAARLFFMATIAVSQAKI